MRAARSGCCRIRRAKLWLTEADVFVMGTMIIMQMGEYVGRMHVICECVCVYVDIDWNELRLAHI